MATHTREAVSECEPHRDEELPVTEGNEFVGLAEATPPGAGGSRFAGMANAIASCIFLRWRRLGAEMRMFSRELERTILPAAREIGAAEAVIRITPTAGGLHFAIQGDADAKHFLQLHQLPAFLSSLGISKIVCDADLESNQVYDILQTIWCAHRVFKQARSDLSHRPFRHDKRYAALTSEQGLHMSCAAVTLAPESETLVIRNSYCQLLFSRVVHAYKKHVSLFKDHRAFFHAAPRYALVAAAIMMLPVLLHVVLGASTNLLVVVSVLLAALVGFGAYVVFQTIAAEEYDKEHQAREIKRRHEALSLVYEKIHLDLKTAREIQRMLLPDVDTQPFPTKLHFVSSFLPEMDVGGDYYDFKRIDDHRVAILLADVCGHGMSAAFITGLVKTIFEYGRGNPSEFMGELNRILERLTPSSHFAAVVFAIYDTATHTLSYSNAGHGPAPIIIRGKTGQLEELGSAVALLAGVDADTEYEEATIKLGPGDKLLLCTDGIPDSVSPGEERFDLERLLQVLREHYAQPPEVLRLKILDAVIAHTDDMPQHDDQTLLLMEVLE